MSRQAAPWSQGAKLAVVAGALGFAWAFLLVTPATLSLLFRPSAEDQEAWPLREITDHGDLALVWRRLKGWPTASGKGDKKPCWLGGSAIWLDHPPLVRGAGPKNGATVVFWVSETIGSEAYFGRYAVDLWYQNQTSTGAGGFTTRGQHRDNTRFVERIPPAKAGPGWRAVLPGQCVWGDVKPIDDKGTLGRFLIDLPAETVIYENCIVDEGKSVPTECVLTLDGKEARHVPGERELDTFLYKTGRAGHYGLTMRRTDAPEKWAMDDEQPSRFHSMVIWGSGGGTYSCHSPRYEQKCYRGKDDEQH